MSLGIIDPYDEDFFVSISSKELVQWNNETRRVIQRINAPKEIFWEELDIGKEFIFILSSACRCIYKYDKFTGLVEDILQTYSFLGELLLTYEIRFLLYEHAERFKLVLNETALVLYLKNSVSLMHLADKPAEVTFTEIKPLRKSIYFPTYIMGDIFYEISYNIERINLE